MTDEFNAELQKLVDNTGIDFPGEIGRGSANVRFRYAAEFLAEVNKKLEPSKKRAKKAKDE